MIRAHGAVCTVVPGSLDHCADVCSEKAERKDVCYANHVYNPFFYEGTKTYIYEVYEQLHRIPANIVVPVGNGTLFRMKNVLGYGLLWIVNYALRL